MSEKAYFNEVKKLEKKLDKIFENFSFNYPKPFNAQEEKEKFFKAYADDRVYNPQFKFRKRNREEDLKVLQQLMEFDIDLSDDIYGFKKLLKEKVKERIRVVESFIYWGTGHAGKYALAAKGKHSIFLLCKAKNFCKKFQREKVKFINITADDVAKELKRAVKRRTGISIIVRKSPDMSAKVKIEPASHILEINPEEEFTSLDLERLKTHEIGCHFMRIS